ncbi:MAG: DUF5672 family protein [Candidatus Omnitrophica bacterium]|nr:DUF5672 family protein [Candidatus Omnitrophota bacterium]
MLEKIKIIKKLICSRPQNPAAVIIPVLKSELTNHEIISLDRCLKILGGHPLIFVGPEGLVFESKYFPQENVRFEYFNKSYFKDRQGYRRLLTSISFYERFLDYEYILIYQLDAFVFKDELLSWCAKGYDYIGAKWIHPEGGNIYCFLKGKPSLLRRILQKVHYPPISKVGNGGFSLRRTRRAVLALLPFDTRGVNLEEIPEDVFWSCVVRLYFPFFKIADWQTADRFAVENMSDKESEAISAHLPFGCHAWTREQNISIWREIFKKIGYDI